MTKAKNILVLALVAGSLVAGSATATTTATVSDQKRLIKAKDWDAFSDTDAQGKKICYMISLPSSTNTSQKVTSRGDTALIVTHRPALSIQGQVEVKLGFSGNEDKGASMSVDGRNRVTLFVNGQTAWSYDNRDDQKLVALMKKGSKLLFTSTSKRGTILKDTYSLSGFTAAYNSITKACK